MGAISVRIPESLHEGLKAFSKKDKVSINQFIVNAIAEKMSARRTEDIIAERAKRGNRETFESILNSAPDVEPEEHDKL